MKCNTSKSPGSLKICPCPILCSLQSHNEHVPLLWPWENRTHLCPSPTFQLQSTQDHSPIPSRDSQQWAPEPGQEEAAQTSELLPAPPQARCLQPELDAFLNQLTQSSTQNFMDQCFHEKNHCSWGGCLFKPSFLLISVLNYLLC